ncbi:MAG TPA: class I adenylate-forming enzyme family protein, partial [Jatrophihabitans sp.]
MVRNSAEATGTDSADTRGLPPARNLLDLVAGSAEKFGDRPFLLPVEPEGRVISFAEVLTFTKGCAALLEEREVPVGARVGVILHNSSLAALLFLGVVAAQRTLVFLNPKAGPAELDAQLADAEPALVLGREATAAKLSGQVNWLAVEDEQAMIADVLARGAAYPGELSPLDRSGAQDAEIVYTSGSTGAAKGVVLPHQSLLAGSLSLSLWADADEDDVFLNVNPMFHAGGHTFPTLTPLWSGGKTVCVRPEAALARFWTYVDRFSPTWTLSVNAYLAHLSENPERPAVRSLKGYLAGGSPLSPELIHRFESTFDIPVYQVYGMTEMATITTVEPRSRKPGDRRTAGLPLDCSRVRIMRPDGSDAAPGENGEVLLAGANMFSRYEKQPELTAERLIDGWIRTGDLGNLDDNGELSIVDRLDSMVIVNGENLYPAEIEGVVPHLTGIQDGVVATLPHPVTGVELVLVYTLLPGAEADEDGWRSTLLQHLSTFKVPRRFVPLTDLGTDAFPRTGLGKIVRPDVQKLAL